MMCTDPSSNMPYSAGRPLIAPGREREFLCGHISASYLEAYARGACLTDPLID